MSENQEALKQDQSKNIKIDPLVLFQQFEQLRKEGVDEETLRTAIAELIDQSKGNYRQAKPAMMRHADAPPVPSQKEINKIYEDQAKDIRIELSLILDAVQKRKEQDLKFNISRKQGSTSDPQMLNRLMSENQNGNISLELLMILDAIQKQEESRLKANSLLKNRIKIYILKKTLPIVIPILQKLGVK